MAKPIEGAAEALRFLAERGQMPSRRVAEHVGWGPRTAGGRMAALERQGLVARATVHRGSPFSDAKFEWVITAKGRDAAPASASPAASFSPEAAARMVREAFDVGKRAGMQFERHKDMRGYDVDRLVERLVAGERAVSRERLVEAVSRAEGEDPSVIEARYGEVLDAVMGVVAGG